MKNRIILNYIGKLYRNEYDPSLGVSKLFKSFLLFISIYSLLNTLLCADFVWETDLLNSTEKLFLIAFYSACISFYIFFSIRAFLNRPNNIQLITGMLCTAAVASIHSVILFLLITTEVLNLSLKQLSYIPATFKILSLADRFSLFDSILASNPILKIFLGGSLVFNVSLVLFPLVIIRGYISSQRQHYFNQYINIVTSKS